VYDERMTAQKLLRLVAWLLVAAIVVVTLGPMGDRPRTILPVDAERALAFFVVGLAFAMAYPTHIWWAVAFVIVGAIGLEWLQNLRPDRHGREADALVKIAGAVIGLGTGWLIAQIAGWRQHKVGIDRST
jgi:VanZ family protein